MSNLGWTTEEVASRVAQDIPDGSYVNVGVGLPVLVPQFVPDGREIIYHSENGILGMAPVPEGESIDPDLINANKEPVSIIPGGSFFHHTDSFVMMRGGHIDVCVLGSYQVATNGDLANWELDDPTVPPAVGGAMDLAVGAKRVFVMMKHTTAAGDPKVVAKCSYPLTAQGCVDRIFTDLAVLQVGATGLRVVELAPGVSADELEAKTDAPLIFDAEPTAQDNATGG